MSRDNEWRAVVGYEGFYEVSATGHVRSLGRQTPAGFRKGHLLKQALSGGYPSVTLCKLGTRVNFNVHQIVCRAFHGPAPSPKHEVAHDDGIRVHVWERNLRWATRKENQADRKGHGTNFVGDRHPMVKICDAMVQVIAAEYVKCSSTHGLKALAKKYGVSLQPIHSIVTGARQVAHA